MKNKTQIVLWLLVVIVFSIAFVVFSDTLALFETDSSGVVNTDVGKWVIKVNDQTITETVNEDIEINSFQYSTDSHVETGYIAPGGTAYFDLVVDARECDVAVLYSVDLNLNAVDYDANVSISLQDLNGANVVRTDEHMYSGIISLASINNNETRTLRVNINWNNDESKNASDTALGEVEDSKLTIPIKFHAQQYLGETLVAYVPDDAYYQIGVSGDFYETLADALSHVNSNQTITVEKNTAENTPMTLPENITGVTLNLNGKTINTKKTLKISNNSDLTITGSGTLTTNQPLPVINNQGTLTISGGTVGSSCNSQTAYCETITSTGNIIINGGTVRKNQAGLGATISNNGPGNVSISSGFVLMSASNSVQNVIHNGSTGTISVSGGTVRNNGQGDAITNAATGNVIVTGGTVQSMHSTAIVGVSTGTITIGVNDGNVKTNTPQVTGSNYGVHRQNTNAILNFFDGKISGGTWFTNSADNINTPAGYNYVNDYTSTLTM